MFSVLSLDSIFIMIITITPFTCHPNCLFCPLTFYCDLFYTINKMRRHPLQLAILLLSIATIHSQFSKCPAANPLQIASGTSLHYIRLDYSLEAGTSRHHQWSRYPVLQLHTRHTVHLHAWSGNR